MVNLKELSVYGFKSFSDKLTLKFDHEITGVVGPNGCGKSNVVDAVRLVLGEQSAKSLRGKMMQDLIFSGTETRRSMSYSEVTAVLDNSRRFFPLDMDEIVISRKLYRTNESEYFINKNLTRLKDITDLLRDAGLSREGYAIVGQGRMDAILNARPEDRRAIFEEALGISKFRVKKIETERKLQKTRDNIVRLHDILTELNRQLNPLKKQANDAKKYIAYQEELKYHEVNTYIFSYDNASDNKRAIKEKIAEIQAKLDVAKEKYQEAYEQYNRVFAEVSDVDNTVKTLYSTHLQLTIQVERYSGEIKLLHERIKNLSERNETLTHEIEESKIAISNNKRNETELSALVVSLRKEVDGYNQKLNLLNETYRTFSDNIAVLSEAVEKTQTELIKNMDKMTTQKTRDSALNSEKNSQTNRLNRIERECGEIEQTLNALTESQSKDIEALLNSNFEQQTTKQMADRIDGYVEKVFQCLSKMLLTKSTREKLTGLVTEISEKCKNELAVNNTKTDNWQSNTILMSVLAERLAKYVALQEHQIKAKEKLIIEKNEINGQLSRINQSLSIIAQEEDRLSKEREEINLRYKQATEEYNLAKTKKDKLQEETNACRLKIMGLSSNINSNESRINASRQNVLRFNSDITQKQRQIETNTANLQDLYVQIEQSGGDAEELAKLAEVKEKLENADRLKQDLQGKMTEADHKRQYFQAEVQTLTDQMTKDEFALSRIDYDIESIQKRIEEQYQLTYSSAMRYKDDNYDMSTSKEQTNKLREQMSKLGYVNLNAVEDYVQIQARFDDINTQVEDLRKAESDLSKFLKDLTREMTVRFYDGFEIINVNFNTVFKELFAGGHARMTIDKAEGKDDLDFGIEIEAQPPGKRLQNISLLSGGERTLTAVAILFAILKLRPMPFCVLDEIEAALDDANAERIASYIRKFSADTQFIVITHKKPTMEACDVLYGVTMEEKGVSKIVSVELTDAITGMSE